MKIRRPVAAFVLTLFSAIALATYYPIVVYANGSADAGVTDGQRAQAAGAAWNDQNPNTAAELGDEISASFISDGWSQRFEVTGVSAGRIALLQAIAGSLRNNGSSQAYGDQVGTCGGTYTPAYRRYCVETTGGGETGSSCTDVLVGFDYLPNC